MVLLYYLILSLSIESLYVLQAMLFCEFFLKYFLVSHVVSVGIDKSFIQVSRTVDIDLCFDSIELADSLNCIALYYSLLLTTVIEVVLLAILTLLGLDSICFSTCFSSNHGVNFSLSCLFI